MLTAEFRDKLVSGYVLHFHPEEPEAARTIQAAWIEEAVRNHVKIDVRNAVIAGALSLKNVTFEEEVSLIDCRFKEPADFSHATFEHSILLSGTTFEQGAAFQGVALHQDAVLDDVKFLGGKAIFIDMSARGLFSAERISFGSGVKADFARVCLQKSARFWGATFGGEVDFDHAHIFGSGDFRGAVFKKKVNFNPSKIDGGLFFRAMPERGLPPVTFEDEADFGAVETAITADFNGAQFKNEHKPVSFNSAKIHGSAIFLDAAFAGKTNFGMVHINGDAFFHSASFASEVSFLEAHITGQAGFSGVVFQQKVSFNSAKISGFAYFRAEAGQPAARFEGEVDFIAAQFGSDVDFDGVAFTSRLLKNALEDKEFRFGKMISEHS